MKIFRVWRSRRAAVHMMVIVTAVMAGSGSSTMVVVDILKGTLHIQTVREARQDTLHIREAGQAMALVTLDHLQELEEQKAATMENEEAVALHTHISKGECHIIFY